MGEDVESAATIPFPCKVENAIHEEPLQWEDNGVRMAYADLKSALDSYATRRPRKVFWPMLATMTCTGLPVADKRSMDAAV